MFHVTPSDACLKQNLDKHKKLSHGVKQIMISGIIIIFICRGSAVGIATGYGLDDQKGSQFEFRCSQEFSPIFIVQRSFGAHLASYPNSTVGSFPGGKAAVA
jgi:hypothetical protein